MPSLKDLKNRIASVRRGLKELKPSTRQRFVTLSMGYPGADAETQIVTREGGIQPDEAARIVGVGRKIRRLETADLRETVSTRLLVHTAKLVRSGVPIRLACRAGILEALTDDEAVLTALRDLVDMAT